MAALQLISLDTTTPQLRAPASGDTYSAPRALDIAPEGLTGSSATSSLSITQTWNTTGAPTAIDLNVTDTASNAASLLMNLRVGGSSLFSVSKAGRANVNDLNCLSGDLLIYRAGSIAARIGTGRFSVGLEIGFSNNNPSSPDTFLVRDAANTLAQRNGVNAQAFNIYNTYTDASNYERGFVKWSSNLLQIGTEAAGTGSARTFVLQANTIEFRGGVAGRDIRVSNGNMVPLSNGNSSLGGVSNRWNEFYQSSFHEMAEQTAPAAPAANNVRIYAEDNGSGKTRLMALFATGAAQQIAIEP